jgi:hypothetical protein
MREQAKEEVEKEDMRAWEEGRERRVDAWRSFAFHKEKKEKKMKMKFGVHAPGVKQEERPSYAKEDADGRPMGLEQGYKKQWR